MPVPYNKDFTRFKSAQLQGLDCNTTTGGITYSYAEDRPVRLVAKLTTADAIEAGKCISMLRVQRGFMVTGAQVAWNVPSAADVIMGLGDPYACGRFSNGPLDFRNSSTPKAGAYTGSFFNCGILTKTGAVGDGCGIGYVFTCDTDVILTNLYGLSSHELGGFAGGAGPSGGGVWGGVLPSGTQIVVTLDGVMTNQGS